MPVPTLTEIKCQRGIAGQISYSTTVQYDGEDPEPITFVGSVYGGPVVMVLPTGTEVFVRHASDLGPFGPDWVRRFFTER